MKASEIMTRDVISVHPDTPTPQIARLLLDKGISAVPVVEDSGAPVGIVSEGDLIGRDESDREARRDWWLALLAEGEALNRDFVASLRAKERLARDIMSGPVVTVNEDTNAGEIARLLQSYHIKRVPVVHDGRIVGIVSRADLLRALAEQAAPAAPRKEGLLASALAGLDERFVHRRHAEQPKPPAPPPEADDAGLQAADFQKLAADFERQEVQQRADARRAMAEQRGRRVAQLIDEHISDESWRAVVQQARRAAEHGEKEFMLLQFPSQLCSDGGRAINATEPDWPATLRGDAAEIYLRWERDLKPRGFPLAARVLEFPDGVPGDVGLFLIWGQ
ncbi:MAG: CBS domain-containing protein [Xanthobacteraceae bacterium]